MKPQKKLWTVAILGVLVGAAMGAGVTFAITGPRASDLKASAESQTDLRLKAESRADKAEADLEAATAEVKRLSEQLKLAETNPGSQPSTETPTPGTAAKPVRQFAFVRSATAGSSPKLVADYAQMLSGKAAAEAATAHGDESPPPNDYYIVNDNKKLRTLPVKSGIKVRLVSKADGTTDAEGYTVAFDKWAGYFAAQTTTNSGILGAGYWLTIDGGIVTAVEEQYVP